MLRLPAAVIICSVALLVSPAGAQDFAALALKPGDTIYVTETTGTEISGRITRVTPDAIAIGRHEFKPTDGLKIERRGDPLWDGALIGLLAGLGLGALVAMGECNVEWTFPQCASSIAIWGGVVGTVIDWRRVGRTLIYVGMGAPSPPARGVGRGSRAPIVSAVIRF